MALEIEDGTGKATAEVYDTTDAAAAWLVKRNPASAFAALDGPGRESSLLQATELAERHVRLRFRGKPRTYGPPRQALLFPASGAYGSDMRLFETDELPQLYRHGIFLLAEEFAGGTAMKLASAAPVASETGKRMAVSYRAGHDLSSIAANHPEAWALLRTALPR